MPASSVRCGLVSAGRAESAAKRREEIQGEFCFCKMLCTSCAAKSHLTPLRPGCFLYVLLFVPVCWISRPLPSALTERRGRRKASYSAELSCIILLIIHNLLTSLPILLCTPLSLFAPPIIWPKAPSHRPLHMCLHGVTTCADEACADLAVWCALEITMLFAQTADNWY